MGKDLSNLEESNWREIIFWFLRLRQRFRITGVSMSPLLNPGDEVLVDSKIYQKQEPQPNEIVVALHPYKMDTIIIKRIVHVGDRDLFYLVGDNSDESADSRSFGGVKKDWIIGKVTSKLPKL